MFDWKDAIIIFLAACLLGLGIGFGKALTADAIAPPPQVIVVTSCNELDAMGYDGLAYCIDANGNLVGPGR